jgi:hypothetical protein
MEIDASDEHFAKTLGSIHESLEPDSNVTVERAEHPVKHSLQIRSTDDGMTIEQSDEQS